MNLLDVGSRKFDAASNEAAFKGQLPINSDIASLDISQHPRSF